MKQIFINLPVEDLEKSTKFYLQLGFESNDIFTDKEQKCMLWSDAIYVMLQSKSFFNAYLKMNSIAANDGYSATYTLPVESTEQVDDMMARGLLAGGSEPIPPLKETYMYLRSIEDLDEHLWGIMYLDRAAFTKQI